MNATSLSLPNIPKYQASKKERKTYDIDLPYNMRKQKQTKNLSLKNLKKEEKERVHSVCMALLSDEKCCYVFIFCYLSIPKSILV